MCKMHKKTIEEVENIAQAAGQSRTKVGKGALHLAACCKGHIDDRKVEPE
jgi:hypothetical protein